MTVRFLLLAIMLFHFSALAGGEEKLVIVQSVNIDIPESVKSAIQAVGAIDGAPGFFIDEGVFAAVYNKLSLSENLMEAIPERGPFPIIHYRKATQKELADNRGRGLSNRAVVDSFFGEGTLAKGKEGIAVFKVNHEDENKLLFTTRPKKFLKAVEFQEGDKVFIITNYHYDYYENPNDASSSYKKRMIMEVSNPDIIKNETTDLEKSTLLNDLKLQVNRSISVNQKGEVIGFIRSDDGQLIKLTPDTIAFLSRTHKRVS